MQISKLDHVNLRTHQLDVMVAWYRDVLGLHAGQRPDFPFPGAWLYAGDCAVVHLIGVDGSGGAGSEGPLKLEHFAFRATDAASFEARLTARSETFRKSMVEDTNTVAFNVWDPDGNHIHVDFFRDP